MSDLPTATAAVPLGPAGLPATRGLRSIPVLAGTVALAAAVGLAQPGPAWGILRAVLMLVLVPCALIDLEHRIIPNRITGPAALVALALGVVLTPGTEPWTLVWAGVAGGFLLVAALVHPAGMGMGDVKLVFVIGLFLGGPVLVALFVALLANVAVGLGLVATRGWRGARKTTMPFGPFLAAGGIVAALAGNALIGAWLSLPH